MDGCLLAALGTALGKLGKNGQGRVAEAPLSDANVPAQPERPSIPTPPVRPSGRKAILIAVIIAALVLVGSAGWYLGQKKKGTPEKLVVTPTETSTPVPMTPTALTPVTMVPTPVPTLTPQSPPPSTSIPTLTTAPPSANVINDEDVRHFVTSFFLAEERGDIDYMLSQYGDAFRWGRSKIRRPGEFD